MSPRRRAVLAVVAVLGASLPASLPMAVATATPAAPAPVLLPAPVVTPGTVPAGTVATVTGTQCVPKASTRVFVSLLAGDGHIVGSTSVVPAADGTWTTTVTPPVASPPGSYAVTAGCDTYGTQRPYRSRPIAVTAATAAPWTGQAPALPDIPNGTLADVDCASATSCAAVGTVSGAGVTALLVETWDGATWTVVPVAAPVVGDVYVSSVACPSVTRCVAVGDLGADTGHRAFVATMSGATWTAQLLPPPDGEDEASLTAVSCPNTTVCVAIGSAGALSEGSRVRAVAYRLQGTTWSLAPDPAAPSRAFALGALSCPDVRTCVAVGSDFADFPTRPIAEVFDGTVWHLSTLAPVPVTAAPYLFDVDCVSGSSCVAVGKVATTNGPERPLVQVFAGSSWRTARVATDPTVGGRLTGVTCVSATRCTAVGGTGHYPNAPAGRPVVATQTGTGWSSGVVDLAAGSTTAELRAVSCPTTCVAVGDAGNLPLAASDTGGGWSDLAAAAPAGYVGGEFTAVACSAADACSAGGFSYNADTVTARPLVDRWDGRSWTTQPLPDVGADVRLAGMACPSRTFCVAVGRIDVAEHGQPTPLVFQWKAGSWRQVTLPARFPGVLTAVSCRSTTSCLAVGQTSAFGGDPVAFALTGTRWSRAATPPLDGRLSVTLGGVSCVVDAGCRVTGSGYDPSFTTRSGIDLVWDGSAFTTGPAVDPVGAVSCTGATRCAALADSYGDDGATAWVLSGPRWTRDPLPFAVHGLQNGIACRDPLQCVAVGSTVGGAAVARRTGGTWRAEPVTPLVPGYGVLHAVSCPTEGWCVAVGEQRAPTIVVAPAG